MTVTNASAQVLEVASDGVLPTHAWPGGYPMFYLDGENNVLCPKCANENDEYNSPLVAYDVNWEEANLFCNHCSGQIEAAYGEDV